MAALGDEYLLVLATIIYLVVFFSPNDIGYKLINVLPVYASICTLKEVQRALKIYKGIKEGINFKSGSIFVPVIVATIKVRKIYRLLRYSAILAVFYNNICNKFYNL